jgi:predicted nuclease with TOPRIM domain
MGRHAVLAEYEDRINELMDKHFDLQQRFMREMEEHNEELQTLWDEIEQSLEEHKPDIADFAPPEAQVANETDEALYDSQRDYFEQLGHYKVFQGKAA